MNTQLFKAFSLKINVFVLLFSLLVFALLIKLGFWQLDRADQKELRVQKMLYYQQQAALGLDDIVKQMSLQENGVINGEQLNDLPVSLSGRFNNGQSFLLDNQVYQGRLGYRVIKVFQDQKSDSAVLVNLGWIEGGIDRSFIPEINDIENPVSFKGNIRILEPPILLADEPLQKDTWPQRVQSIEINKISKLLSMPLLPFMVYVDNEDTLGFIKEWVPIVMPPEKHRGYAFQWFSLSLAWLLLMLAAAYKSVNTSKEQ